MTPATAQYWRHGSGSAARYFKMVDGADYLLRDGQWVAYNHYKSGPTWWRLTGEIDADVIDQSDLPPDAPR